MRQFGIIQFLGYTVICAGSAWALEPQDGYLVLTRLAILITTICIVIAIRNSNELRPATWRAAYWGGITASAIVGVGYINTIVDLLTIPVPPWQRDELTIEYFTAVAVYCAGLLIPSCALFGASVGLTTYAIRCAFRRLFIYMYDG